MSIFEETGVAETNPIDTHVGRRIRERRIKLGWTLLELSTKLGMSHQQVQKYEQGITRISVGILYQLSQIFQTDQDFFFEGLNVHQMPQFLKRTSETVVLDPIRQMNILLIEDDPADELLTRKALEASDFDVRVYCLHDGDQVISFMRQEKKDFPRPDLVLLDLNMPRRDGHYLLKEIKRDRDIQDIPVVVITNSINRREMLSTYKNGAGGYICKSFDYDRFKNNLQNMIKYWGESAILPNMN